MYTYNTQSIANQNQFKAELHGGISFDPEYSPDVFQNFITSSFFVGSYPHKTYFIIIIYFIYLFNYLPIYFKILFIYYLFLFYFYLFFCFIYLFIFFFLGGGGGGGGGGSNVNQKNK